MKNPFELLINEVRLLYHSVSQIVEDIHGGSNISVGMRAVLEYLEAEGDSTVPHMARARRVTRQRIQTLVNLLLARDLVKSVDNPATKRSPLIALTDADSLAISGMRQLEAKELLITISEKQLLDTTETLARLRAELEQKHQRRD